MITDVPHHNAISQLTLPHCRRSRSITQVRRLQDGVQELVTLTKRHFVTDVRGDIAQQAQLVQHLLTSFCDITPAAMCARIDVSPCWRVMSCFIQTNE